jgi:hypothetical protein
MPDPFDPDTLRTAFEQWQATRPKQPVTPPQWSPRHKPGQRFLRGSVSWDWLVHAGRLPGRALHVGLLLWRSSSCQKSPVVNFRLGWGAELGLDRWATRRGLRSLEAAGLVAVQNRVGRDLLVELLEAHPDDNDN